MGSNGFCGECLLQKTGKKYKIMDIVIKKVWDMNFNDKRVRRIVAVVIMVIIAAMVATTIIPAMMG